MKIILLFLFALNLIAQDDYSLRVAYGKAASADLGNIMIGNFSQYEKDLSVLALDGGYLLQKSAFKLPLDVYAKASISQFDESAVNKSDVYEAALYLKLFWNFDFLDNRVRFGFGEGLSYASDILYYEEAEASDGKTSYLLNYLDISLDFDFGKLVNYKPLHGTYIGWVLKHRSGIFGLINGVRKGGSNYNCVYLEKTF